MNDEHSAKLREGVAAWNAWRQENPRKQPDLSSAVFLNTNTNLSKANLSGTKLMRANLSLVNLYQTNLSQALLQEANLTNANLSEANLIRADLSRASLSGAKLTGANLSGAYLSEATLTGARLSQVDLFGADLSYANLSGANLSQADLTGAKLFRADLSQANLSKANLSRADVSQANLIRADLSQGNLSEANLSQVLLVNTNLKKANLKGCLVYGLSVWDVQLDGAIQTSLRITPFGEPAITVDNLEVAQFIYLLLKNEKIRQVIDTITSKVVLILGRFTPERKTVLDAIRDELRTCDLLPILFDFDKPSSRDTHETITTLARMARFVIADITEPKSIPQELVSIVEQLPSVPVQPILQHGHEPWGMFDHIRRYPWVLSLHEYHGVQDLVPHLKVAVIALVGHTEARL